MYRCAVLLLLFCGASHAASLFEDDTVLDVTLAGPLAAVIEDSDERGERRFTISVDGIETAVAVRTRGKSRVELCNFPPLRLNFSSDHAEGTVFAGLDKLKLVTHCRRSGDYQKNVIEEYAAYRIMNVLTDVSLRVRLLRVGYVDTEKPGRDPDVHFAFIIEADESLVARLGASMLNVPHVTKGMFNAEHAALGFVFQYLIGNTDWSFVRVLDDEHCCHNGKLISIGEQSYYLPYDFDMSGLVDARHARPNPRLKLKSVTVRRYRGYCTDQAILRGAIRAVLRQREPILDVIAGLPGLHRKEIASRTRYLQKFFDRAADEDRLIQEFERRCLD